jgi:excisionase family DNA binding protein
MNTERISFEEACRELGISEEELEQLVAAGEISSIKEGDTLFFKKDVVRKFKKSREGSASILVSDDDLDDLLEADATEPVGDTKKTPATEPVGSKKGGGPKKDTVAPGSRIELSLDDDLEFPDVEVRAGDESEAGVETKDVGKGKPGAGKKEPAKAGKKAEPSLADDETLLNIDGLLEEESEATTPVPGARGSSRGGGDEADSTLLDTDLLDLGGGKDPFASDTVEETVATDLTEAGTLLRGGGARVMQMKRKASHAGWTAAVAVAAVILLLPLGVMTNMIFVHSGKDKQGVPPEQSYKWIIDANVIDGAVEAVADMFKK